MNLNLLRTFVAVYEAKSLTVAAERLFVTPPAVSQAIDRLRRDLGDPLFTRVDRQMEPTALAHSLYPELSEALGRIDRAVAGVRGFDPATSHHQFTIALSELGEIRYLPVILSHVHAEAPHVSINTVALDTASVNDWLERGTVDLAITSSPLGDKVVATTLQSVSYVMLMSPKNPLADAELTLEQYESANHVVVKGDSGYPNVAAVLQELGVHVKATVSTNHFAALPPLLTMDDFVATVPDTLASQWVVSLPLVARELPFQVEHVDVRLCKRATTYDTAALAWLSSLVERAARTTPERYFAITNDAVSP